MLPCPFVVHPLVVPLNSSMIGCLRRRLNYQYQRHFQELIQDRHNLQYEPRRRVGHSRWEFLQFTEDRTHSQNSVPVSERPSDVLIIDRFITRRVSFAGATSSIDLRKLQKLSRCPRNLQQPLVRMSGWLSDVERSRS